MRNGPHDLARRLVHSLPLVGDLPHQVVFGGSNTCVMLTTSGHRRIITPPLHPFRFRVVGHVSSQKGYSPPPRSETPVAVVPRLHSEVATSYMAAWQRPGLTGGPVLAKERKSPSALIARNATSAKPPPQEKRSLAGGPPLEADQPPAPDRAVPAGCRATY